MKRLVIEISRYPEQVMARDAGSGLTASGDTEGEAVYNLVNAIYFGGR